MACDAPYAALRVVGRELAPADNRSTCPRIALLEPASRRVVVANRLVSDAFPLTIQRRDREVDLQVESNGMAASDGRRSRGAAAIQTIQETRNGPGPGPKNPENVIASAVLSV